MNNQALFSSKEKSKKLKCCLLQFLFGVLMVKQVFVSPVTKYYKGITFLALLALDFWFGCFVKVQDRQDVTIHTILCFLSKTIRSTYSGYRLLDLFLKGGNIL